MELLIEVQEEGVMGPLLAHEGSTLQVAFWECFFFVFVTLRIMCVQCVYHVCIMCVFRIHNHHPTTTQVGTAVGLLCDSEESAQSAIAAIEEGRTSQVPWGLRQVTWQSYLASAPSESGGCG